MSENSSRVTGTLLRREPKQERSRERIDDILKVAMDLIGQKGIDAVTMKEIAALSGGPIASVYQYFPNKSAIVATLHERYSQEIRAYISSCIESVTSAKEAGEATERLLDIYYSFVREHPSTQELMDAIRADKKLAELDIAETRYQTEMFTAGTEAFIPETLREQYRRTVFLMFYLSASAVRLARMATDEEAEKILADFKTVAKAQMWLFIKGDYPGNG